MIPAVSLSWSGPVADGSRSHFQPVCHNRKRTTPEWKGREGEREGEKEGEREGEKEGEREGKRGREGK